MMTEVPMEVTHHGMVMDGPAAGGDYLPTMGDFPPSDDLHDMEKC